MNVAAGAALGAVALATAPLVAGFFGTDELTAIVRVLAIDIVLLGVIVVPQALLMRGLRFRTVALVEVAAATVGGGAGVAAVLLGADYWALVVQTLVTDGLLVAGFLVSAGRLPLTASRESLSSLWSFSSRMLGFQAVNYVNRHVDNLLVGRVLGATQLGLYALSYRTMMLAVQNLGQVANRIAFPMFSRVQDERERLGRQFLAGTRLIAVVAFPFLGLVVVGAPTGVPLIFGEQWEGAAVPMQILAIAGMVQSVATPTGGVLMACGRADWLLRWGIGSTLLTTGAVAIGLRWGIVGVAAGCAASSLVRLPIVIRMVGGLVDFRLAQFARELTPSVAGTAVLVAVGAAAEHALGAAGLHAPLALVGALGAGYAAFLATLRLGWPDWMAEARGFVRLVRGGGRPAAAAAS
jgi:PST family polysaccharide transporter